MPNWNGSQLERGKGYGFNSLRDLWQNGVGKWRVYQHKVSTKPTKCTNVENYWYWILNFNMIQVRYIKLDISFQYEQNNVFDYRYCHKMEDTVPGKLW